MFSRRERMIGALYLAADALLGLASFLLANAVRASLATLRPLYPLSHYPWMVAVALGIWLAVGLATGIYREIREEDLRRAFADPLKVAWVSAPLLFAVTFALKLEYVSRLLLGLFAVFDLAGMILFRLLARRLGEPLRGAFGGLRHVLLVGDTPQAVEIARTLEAHERRAIRLFGFAVFERGSPDPPTLDQAGLSRVYPVYGLSRLPELLREHIVDEVIFAVAREELEKLEATFLLCEEEGVKTRVLLSFFPHVLSKVHLERLRDMPLLTFSTTPENDYLLLVKRVTDFVMAAALLVVLAPLYLLLAALIKLTSRGPVLYRQTRCGLGGRKFTVYKFRSMRPDADLLREELVKLNERDGPAFKIKEDPRCTPVGKVMRKFSLDELPQLVNILRGDMSFVGPRPPLPEEVEKYEPWQRRRLRMQPGLTCLWALEGRSQLDFRRWMELDLEYIDTWSLGRDVRLVLDSAWYMASGRNY